MGKPITVAVRMNGAAGHHDLNTRQRWISIANFIIGGAIVIAHNVYHRVPNEVPILILLGGFPPSAGRRVEDGGPEQA